MKTLITGASGLVGNGLVDHLFKHGHSIQCLQRTPTSEHKNIWATQSLPKNTSSNFDTVIHLAGKNVAQGRWTSKSKNEILQSRVKGTRELVDYISSLSQKPKLFICASAVGYYGSMGDQILDESCSLGEGFLADVCKQWEEETFRLHDMGIRVVNLRFGMILSPKGGALQKMKLPFKMGLGGVIGSGKQYISWISMRDLVNIVDFVISNETISGPVNVVSPNQVTNKQFTKSLGRALRRPTLFMVPSAIAKVVFGQMADEMLLTSARATPKVLLDAGYEFVDQSLDAVLNRYVGCSE